MHEVNEIFQPSHYLSKFITHVRWLAMRTLLCQRPSYMIHCLSVLGVFHKKRIRNKEKCIYVSVSLFHPIWLRPYVLPDFWIRYFLLIFHSISLLVVMNSRFFFFLSSARIHRQHFLFGEYLKIPTPNYLIWIHLNKYTKSGLKGFWGYSCFHLCHGWFTQNFVAKSIT